jgi:NACHT domain-containing protein/pentapeptide repeat protein
MAKKSASKKTTSKKPVTSATSRRTSASRKTRRALSAKASVEKGRKFEDDVANLYRLLGADVIKGIEISQKKVDLLVTFSYPVRHRLIVECKDERRVVAANQRVMQFQGLLDIARKTGEADSAEIITRVPWGDTAKGFAHRAGISLLTYTEKLAKLIDFTPYLQTLINRFEKGDPSRPSEPPLGKYYVDLSAERVIQEKSKGIPVIDAYINQWLEDDQTMRHLAIFGEYGAGKSSLCQKLAHDMAVRYLKDPNSTRVPIVLNLRVFVGKVDMEAYIGSFLDRECKVVNPRFELFREMNNAGIFLLVFDGFDEMAVKVDADTLESNLIEIEKLAASPNSKSLLTSRPEHFISTEEEKQAISPSLGIFKNREIEYDPLKLLPWDEKKVDLFLKRRVPLVKEAKQPWTYYRDRIRKIRSLSDLSQRPVLLDMIVKTLPKLIESGTTINLPNLYKTYLVGEIKRQKVLKRRTLLLTDQDRLSLLQQLAVDFYTNSISAITFPDALNRVEQRVGPPKQELEAHGREFLTNSFLVRRGDAYYFSHKSIMEYLVSDKLIEEIRIDSPDIFARFRLQPVVLDFLREFEPHTKTLWKWIYNTRDTRNHDKTYLGGNAATVLCAFDNSALIAKDLSHTNLTAADLSSVDLREANLEGTILNEARLVDAMFLQKDIASADLSGCWMPFHVQWDFSNTETREVVKILNSLVKQSPNVFPARTRDVWRGTFKYAAEGRSYLTLEILIRSIDSVEIIREKLSTGFTAVVSIYANEIESLAIYPGHFLR